MFNLLLIPVAAFLIMWSTVITFNRAYIDDSNMKIYSWVLSLILLVAALGLVVYVAA